MCDLLVVRCSNIFCALHHSWRARCVCGGGVKKCQKNDPPFFEVRKHKYFPFFSDVELKKCFPVSTTAWWSGTSADCSLCSFQPFLLCLVLLAVVVTLW